jgi:hypothetical protein
MDLDRLQHLHKLFSPTTRIGGDGQTKSAVANAQERDGRALDCLMVVPKLAPNSVNNRSMGVRCLCRLFLRR